MSDHVKQHATRDFLRCTPRLSEKGYALFQEGPEGVESKMEAGREGRGGRDGRKTEDADLFMCVCLCGSIRVGVRMCACSSLILHGGEESGFHPAADSH